MNFKMSFGRGAYYMIAIGIVVESLMAIGAFYLGITSLGIIIVLGILIMAGLAYTSFYRDRYEVTDSEIITHVFGSKKRAYAIDKITLIRYIDLGTEWGRNPPNARYQLEIHFDRAYLKSVMPIRFAPDDRDAFVAALLPINPTISIEK